MPGSPATRPDPETSRRLGLVVATGRYADPGLRRLRAPARDAAELGDLLADPGIGGFEVTVLRDATAHRIRLAVEDFLAERSPDDLVLLYLSCHGLVDLRRRLYFAATDTRKERLAATGVEAQWVLDQLEDCRARRQVVLLDCCFSGAFAHGAKGAESDDVALGERLLGHGRGRVVLTASRASEYSFEGEPLPGASSHGSVFTGALVEGLRSGAADSDGDGWVSVDDAYAYAFERVRRQGGRQTPQRWLYGAEGSIVLARSPAGPRPDASSPHDGSERPPVPAVPAVPGRRRPRWRRGVPRRRWLVAGLVATAVAVLAPVGLWALERDGGGAPATTSARETITMDAPWRLAVREQAGLEEGCVVRVLGEDGAAAFSWQGIYGTETFQVPRAGTFSLETNDPGCELVPLRGQGEQALPFAQECCLGDTPAFPAPDQVAVEVLDFNGNSTCSFDLLDADGGGVVHFGSATPGGGPLLLDPGGAERVYLADLMCGVRVSAAG